MPAVPVSSPAQPARRNTDREVKGLHCALLFAFSIVRALRRAAAGLFLASRRSPPARRDRPSEPASPPPRGGPASRFFLPVPAGPRSGAARALAGTFLLLVAGLLAASPARAQTYPPVPNVVVAPVAGSSDKLDVSWGAVEGATNYIVFWRGPGVSTFFQVSASKTVYAPATSTQITGLEAETAYDVRVTAYTGPSAIANTDVAGTRTNVPRGRPVRLRLSLSPSSLDETAGTQTVAVTVTLVGGTLSSPGVARVACGANDDSATVGTGPGADLSCPRLFEVPIAAGTTRGTANIEVTVFDDDDYEYPGGGDESVSFRAFLAAVPGTAAAKLYIEDDDGRPTATISGGDAVTEGEAATFTVTLSKAAPEGGLVVSYWQFDASGGGRFLEPQAHGRRLGVRVPAGAREATIEVRTFDDYHDEPDGDVQVLLVRGDDYDVDTSFSRDRSYVRVRDNDPYVPKSRVTISGGDAVTEGSSATFTVRLSNARPHEFHVRASVSEAAGSDFLAPLHESSRLLVFREGETELRFGIPTDDDGTDEPDGSVTVALRVEDDEPYNELGNPSSAAVAVRDDDAPPPVVTIAAGGDAVTEGADASFTVTASFAPSSDLPVTLTLADPAGSDFLAPSDEGSKTVTIPAGQTSATLTVSTVADGSDEPDGAVSATVVAGAGYTAGSPSRATVTVRDDDPGAMPGLSVAQEGNRDARLLVQWQRVNGAVRYVAQWKSGGQDYSDTERRQVYGPTVTRREIFLTLGTVYDVRVSAWDAQGTLLAHGERRAQTLERTPSVTITGGGAVTEGSTAWFTARLSNPRPVGFLVLASVSEAAGSDFLSPDNESNRLLNFAAGETELRFGIPTDDDGTDEPDGSVTVTLGLRGDGTGYTLGNPSRATVAVSDDDDPVPAVTVAGGGAVTEGSDATFTVTASFAPSSDLPVTLTLADPTGSDFLAAADEGARTVTIPAGQTSATLAVPTVADGADEPDGAVSAALAVGAGYTAGSPSTATVTVRDDDPAAFSRFNVYAAELSAQVGVDWNLVDRAVSYVVQWKSGEQDYSDTERRLALGPGISGQYIQGLAFGTDYDVKVSAYDAHGALLARGEGSAQTLDKAPSVTIVGGGAVTEGSKAWFTVRLSNPRPVGFLVRVAVSDAAGSDFLSPLNESGRQLQFKAGRTELRFGIPTEKDGTDEPDGPVTVTLRLPERESGIGYTLGSPSSASVTVRDDDAPAPAAGPSRGTGAAPPLDTFTIYHDPDGPAPAVGRYETAVKLLDDAQWTYEARTVTGGGKVDRLAGVSNSVLPRFFLGDPEDSDWGPAQAKVNNGGLRWLRSKLAALQSQQPPVPGVSVADARVREAADAVLAFRVTLDRAPARPVTVDYATADGTATAGADYTTTAGRLRFAAGETEKTVRVAVLDDAHDEGEETLRLVLSNATGLRIAGGEATGTIENTDAMPGAWLARMGRTIGSQAVDALGSRFAEGGGSHGTLGGQSIAAGGSSGETLQAAALAAGAERPWWRDPHGTDPETRTLTAEEFLAGTSFHLASGRSGTGGPGLAAWGRFATTAFEGEGGGVDMDGTVTTGFLGADAEWDRALAGLMVSHSRGEGTYRGADGPGKVESTLTGVYPYARLALSERVSAWGLAGMGEGELTLEPDGQDAMETDVSLRMGAVGVTGRLLDGEDGLALDLRSDAMWVGAKSDAVPGMAASESDVTRLKLVLDGSRAFQLGDGATLTPSAELGLRVDGGDAETGFGTEVGAGVAWFDPRRGLSAEAKARGLLTHEDSGFRERGVSGGLTWDPRPSSERGPSLTLRQTVGVSDASGVDALLARDDLAGLAADDDGRTDRQRFEARLSYGLPAFDGALTATPEVGIGLSDTGRDYTLGWRLAPGAERQSAFEFRVEALRRESANDDGPPEHGIGFRLGARW